MSGHRTLIAVCDVLVIKALESVGKRVVRADRSRWRALGDRPFYIAHVLWEAGDAEVAKALRGAWDVVPVILETHGECCAADAGRVTEMLDAYVHDLCITGTPHDLRELEYRFRTRLGITRDGTTEADGPGPVLVMEVSA